MIQIVGLRGVYGADYIPGAIRVVSNHKQLFTKINDIIEEIPENQRFNVFYTLAHHRGAEGADHAQRSIATFDYQDVLAFDIDAANVDRHLEYTNILSDVLKIPPTFFIIVCSGRGLHYLVWLEKPIKKATFFAENKEYYKDVCNQITQKINEKGLEGYADPNIFDAARIFRLPETLNQKEGKPTVRSKLIQFSELTVDLSLAALCGALEAQSQNVPSDEVRRVWPEPDFKEIVKECRFVDWAINKPEELHEPQVFDLMSLLSNQKEASTVEFEDREVTAKELCKMVMDRATASASLKTINFEDKFKQASKYGVRKCDTINQNWGMCDGCPHFKLIPTPLALKSHDHIGTASTGFWIRDKKGKPLYPDYAGLTQHFKNTQHIKTTQKGISYGYNGGIYTAVEPLKLKGDLNLVMNPSSLLKENYRQEFLAFLKASTCLDTKGEDEFFSNTLDRKINMKNGVYDFNTKSVLPHSPQYGFKSMIPHEYKPGQTSKTFLDWLDTITLKNTNLKSIIMDMMAYCVWPKYDNHAFFLLSGDGKNGKSTLLAILRAVLGDRNCSTISLSQLVDNRFAVAQLEAKFANISDEGSGVMLGQRQLNILKTLSSGERYFVEHKGVNGYDITNTAKLIFSANKDPEFRENSEAMRRRIVVIPFNYKIPTEDASIGEALVKEAPVISSMLVDHICLNLEMNGGKFRLNKEIEEVKAASRRLLYSGNPVVRWAEEHLEDGSEGEWLDITQTYNEFLQWATNEEKLKDHIERSAFTAAMKSFFLKDIEKQYGLKKLANGKVVRAFYRLRHKRDHFYGKETKVEVDD